MEILSRGSREPALRLSRGAALTGLDMQEACPRADFGGKLMKACSGFS